MDERKVALGALIRRVAVVVALGGGGCGDDADASARAELPESPSPDSDADASAKAESSSPEAFRELTLVKETKLSKIFPSLTDDREASGVTVVDTKFYVVFDNMTMLGVVDQDFARGSLTEGAVTNSQYEGITYAVDPRRFFVVQEVDDAGRGVIVELDPDGRRVTSTPTDVVFSDTSKGFEGIAWLSIRGDERLLALCEANFCETTKKSSAGNGRIKVLRRESNTWTTEATLNIPPSADFRDYSDMALIDDQDGSFTLAIVSQESSALWTGRLTSEPWSLEGPGSVYAFPTTKGREIQYCNIEGVAFLTRNRLVTVSDRSSEDGPCADKDESIQIFDVP